MLDIGWMELLVIGIVALIVVGPKELPGMFRTAGLYMGKARGMAREFQRSMEQAANETGLNESAKALSDSARHLNSVGKLNLNSATSSARKYAEKAVKDGKPAAGAAPAAAASPPADPTPSPTPAAPTPEAPDATASPAAPAGPGDGQSAS